MLLSARATLPAPEHGSASQLLQVFACMCVNSTCILRLARLCVLVCTCTCAPVDGKAANVPVLSMLCVCMFVCVRTCAPVYGKAACGTQTMRAAGPLPGPPAAASRRKAATHACIPSNALYVGLPEQLRLGHTACGATVAVAAAGIAVRSAASVNAPVPRCAGAVPAVPLAGGCRCRCT